MNNIDSTEHNNEIEEMKNTNLLLGNFHPQNEINLNGNDLYTREKNIKTNKKITINIENIQRKNQNLEIMSKQSIEISSKSQIIVISRKRKREEDSELVLSNDLKEKSKIVDQKINSINPNKKFRIDNQNNFDISNKLDKLKLQEPATDIADTKKFEIKNRNFKNFSQNKCKACTSEKTKNDIYNNYYPVEVPTDYSLKIMQDNFDSKLEDTLKQISERRQLKFMEKRNIFGKGNLSKELNEIKVNCNKFFDNYQIINENDNEKLIILNHNPVDKKHIKAFLEMNMEETPDLKIYECSNNMNESDILNLIAKDDVVLDGELESDSDINKELDYDSNCEDNSDNDYPDEKEDEDDDSNENYYQDYDHQNYGSDNYL